MARTARPDSQVGNYFNRARQHYSYLKILNDDSFLNFFGCSKSLKKRWHERGIKKIYVRILDLLDELKMVKADRDRLEKQLKELLTKNKPI